MLDDLDPGAAFTGLFTQTTFAADAAKLEHRSQRQRKVAKTPKQRERVANKTAAINMRVSPETKKAADALVKVLGAKNRSEAVEMAIAALARQHGILMEDT